MGTMKKKKGGMLYASEAYLVTTRKPPLTIFKTYGRNTSQSLRINPIGFV